MGRRVRNQGYARDPWGNFHTALGRVAFQTFDPMELPKRGTGTASHLDAIRGASALFVLAGHARAMTLVDWDQAQRRGILTRVLYFLTGLHHHAVMVFFVLSGFFISGSVLKALGTNRWDLRRYATARLVRLLVVLIPAIVLGVLLDRVGLRMFAPSSAYAPGFGHMTPTDLRSALGGDDVVRSLLFLQTITGPVVGTNGPSWSLANEFWYYVAFPCLALAFWPGALVRRIVAAGAGLAVCALIGPVRALYFGVWLLGTAVALLPPTRLSRSKGFAISSWIAFAASLLVRSALAHSESIGIATDVLIAITFALALWSLTSRPHREASPNYGRTTAFVSGFSYTLYLVHVPFLTLGAAYLLGRGDRLQPSAGGLGTALALAVGAVLYAIGVWSLAERHTDAVRKWIEARLLPQAARQNP